MFEQIKQLVKHELENCLQPYAAFGEPAPGLGQYKIDVEEALEDLHDDIRNCGGSLCNRAPEMAHIYHGATDEEKEYMVEEITKLIFKVL